MKITIVGNPENRRVTYFMDAARRLGIPAPHVVSWLDCLRHPSPAQICDADLIRIDSPGENFFVEVALVARGARRHGALPPLWTSEPEDRGRIRDQGLWFEGFKDILEALSHCRGRFMTPPSEILAMFDKIQARERHRCAGAPMPGFLGNIDKMGDLMALAKEHQRMFIKPRFGSSASGVIAFRSRPRQQMTTSVELHGEALYNSLKIRTYTDSSAQSSIVDSLAADGLFAEQWIPKASKGGAFDFRVFVVAGRPEHTVMRVSQSPLTNLHLGNQRGDLEAFRASQPQAFEAVQDAAVLAASGFSALSCGVDVALEAAMKRAYVLETNAFGDLLPNVYIDGKDTYTRSLEEALKR
jgi:glutathione synthase/RimK-type ligase-like ATP-grasp enzyme